MDARVSPISVAIADDQPLLRDALVDFIELFDDLHVTGAVGSGQAALELVRADPPDVVLLDIRMPGGGPLLVGAIRNAAPGTRILVVSAAGGREIVLEMLEAGADGYLVKGELPMKVVDAIRGVVKGERPVSAELLDDEVRAAIARLEQG